MAKVKLKSRLGSLLRGDLRGGQDNVVASKTVRPSGITISLVKGRLEKEDVDVIVNSLSVSMNLEHGVLTTAISGKAGPGLQAAVDEFPGPAHYGDVFKTAGFKLKARAVYHVVVCGFNYPNAGDVLEELVLRCLELADKDKRSSISIPALGTGRHAFPPFVVAHRMVEAVRRYEERVGHNPNVKKIRFVFSEPRCQTAFLSTLSAIPNASQKQLVEKMKSFRKSAFGLRSTSVMRPSSLMDVGDENTEGAQAPPPPPPAFSGPPTKAKRPNKLQNKLVKALGVHKTFKKEQLISQLRTRYRELPLPAPFVPWNYVVTSKGNTVHGSDIDALLESTVSADVHKKRSLVLVHGLAYSGKSSLVNRIARVWADGGLRHIRLVIVVNLHVLLTGGGLKTPSLRECLLQCLASAGIDTSGGYQLFEFSSGKMLLLIDDAEAWCEQFRDELALDPLFAKAHVIVTSRTSSSVRLADGFHPKLTVELCGFGPKLIQHYLRLKDPENSAEVLNVLAQFTDSAGNQSAVQTPGWLEHFYEVISRNALPTSSPDTVLRRQIWMLNAYLEITTDPDWLKEFTARQLQLGEAFLGYLIHKKDPAWAKFEKLNLLNMGTSPRCIIDYSIAAHIVEEIRKTGQPPYSLNTMERIYLLQTSLEMACGHNQQTARVINKLITMVADDDSDVQLARERALDTHDTQSARTLKRVNDLQVACLRQCSSPSMDEPDIPEELQYLGTEYARVYLMACEQGTKSVRRTRVMLVGHFGAGKTSLKRRLLNQRFQAEYLITNGIDADPSACIIQVDDTCNWNLLEEALRDAQADEHSREVARLVYSFIKKLKGAELPVSDEPEVATPDVDFPDTNIDFATFAGPDSDVDEIDGPVLGMMSQELLDVDGEDRAPSPASSNGSGGRPMAHRSVSMNMLVEAMGEAGMSDAEKVVDSLPPPVLKELKKLMLRDLQEHDPLNRSGRQEVKFTFWDFAGQNVFYTTHQTFLSHRAIYILALDLTRPLDFRIETYRLSRHGKVIDRACPQTVGGYLDYWLNSIHTHAVSREPQQSGLLQPPVIIVCTHKDTLEKTHGKEAADRMVKEYFTAIEKHLDKKTYHNHVYPKFFAVANSVEDDPVIDKVRKALVQVAEEQPYWGEHIPLKWLALRTKLREVQQGGGSVTSMTEIVALGEEVGLGGMQEITTVLLFYHALGELVFFDEEHLRDFVILDPQWLIENFREVITIRQFHKQRMFSNSRGHWANLDDYGVLNDVILQNVWAEDSKEQLVSIMQKFNLILPISYDYQPDDDFQVPDLDEATRLYLVPCMLPQVTDGDIVPLMKDDPAPVMVSFKEGFVPLGLFHRLLATCINQLHWQPFGAVYHDYASFLPDEAEPVTISLHMKEAHIEVTARSLDMEEEPEQGQGDVIMRSPIMRKSEMLPAALNTLVHQLEVSIRTVSPTQQVFLAVRCTCKGAGMKGALVKLDKFRKQTGEKRFIMCLTHKKPFSAQPIAPWFIKPPDPTLAPVVGVTVTAPPPPEEEIPTEHQLLSLAEELSHEWEELGLHLGVPRAQINQCKMDNPHNARMRITDMLVRWRGRSRDKRCSRRLDQLTQCLLATRRADLAEKVAQWRLVGKDLNLDWDEVTSKRASGEKGRLTI